MNKKFYNLVVIGSLFLSILICWRCGPNPQEISNADGHKRLPVSLSSKTFTLDNHISNTISRYQSVGSELFFSVDQDQSNTLYQLDFTTDQIIEHISFDEDIFPFETEFFNLEFFVRDPISDEIWIYDPGRKSFHIIINKEYRETINLPKNEFACSFNNTNTRVGIWSQNNAVHMFTSCYINSESSDFYKLATNVSRLKMDLNKIKSMEYFVPYPEDYHGKFMPINALVNMQAQVVNDLLYLNFVASPEILVVEDLTIPSAKKIKIQSRVIKEYQPLPPALTGNSYEEMDHHYRQGFYPNLHVWEDGQLLIRIVTTLDQAYINASFASQKERMQEFGPAMCHSIIFFDLENERVLGEFRLAEEHLFPSISFIQEDVLYINQYSTLAEDEGKLIFRGLSLIDIKRILTEESGKIE